MLIIVLPAKNYSRYPNNNLFLLWLLVLSLTSAMTTTTTMSKKYTLRFCDIGANLLDDRFLRGVYRGTPRHEPDLDLIMARASSAGVRRIVLTAGTIVESRAAVQAAREWNQLYSADRFIHFSCTVGVHPTRCQQVFCGDDNEKDDEMLLQELLEIAKDGQSDNTVVAVGEIGLDYDRLEFCPKDIQKRYLVRQLETLAASTGLPLFLHNRSVQNDLYDILKEHQDLWKAGGGVVHSFDDTLDLAHLFMDDLGLFIGLNGCSLRTPENLETAAQLPLHRILLETDCPYCDIRKAHAGYALIQTHFEAKAEKKFERGFTVKSRQEPCHLVQVAEIVAGVRQNVDVAEVAHTCWENSLRLFGWKDDTKEE